MTSTSAAVGLIDRGFALLHARAVTACVIIGSSLAAFSVIVWSSSGSIPTDFLIYRAAADAAAHGADIYIGNFARPSLPAAPFTYTPFAAVVLAPTTLLGWHAIYLLWTAMSMIVLGTVTARFVPADQRHRRLVIAAVICLGATSCIVVQNVQQGHVNVLLMGLCLGDLFRRDDTVFGRTVPRGVLVGIAAAIKLTPGLFVVFFVVTAQWRLVRGSAAGAAGATLIAAMIHPAMTATFFRTALWSLQDRVDLGHSVGYWGNTSIDGAVSAIGPWAAYLAVPIALSFGAGALLAARRTYRSGREADAWLIVGVAAPLVSPFSWAHHLVYLLPALTTLALTRPWMRRTPAMVGTAVVLLVLPFDGALGNYLLHYANPWLFVPGVLMREHLVLVSVGCIVALLLEPTRVRDSTRVSPEDDAAMLSAAGRR
jgi:alpha-1,2-mannosyltransferase